MTMTTAKIIFSYLFFFGATWFSGFLLLVALLLSSALYYRGSPTVRRVFGIGVKFLVSMFVMTIIYEIVWEKFVDGKLYETSDPLFGYVTPGDLPGDDNNWPVVVVKHFDPSLSIGAPDEIKKGWSVADLWGLWFSFFGASLVSSILFAWWPDPRTPALYFMGSPTVCRVFGIGVKFLVSMIVMTIICSIVWDKFVDGKIYDGTFDDDTFLSSGYLNPGWWVSDRDNYPIAIVPEIVSHHSTYEPDKIKEGWVDAFVGGTVTTVLNKPDEIKKGWSVADLWGLWWSFFGTSLVISILFAWVRWIPLIKRAFNTA